MVHLTSVVAKVHFELLASFISIWDTSTKLEIIMEIYQNWGLAITKFTIPQWREFGFLRLRSRFCSQVFVIVLVQFRSFAFIFRNLSQTGSVVLLCLVLTAQCVMSVALAGAFYLNVKKKRKVRRKTRYFNSRYNLKPRNNILPLRPFTTEYLYQK